MVFQIQFVSVLSDRLIRHRACTLKDSVHAIIKDELDEEFEKICVEIREARIKRGHILLRSVCFRNLKLYQCSLSCCCCCIFLF